MQASSHPRTETLSRQECLTLLEAAPMGRLAVVVAGRPEIYPVNHALHGGDIIFRTGSGTKLDASVGQYVAFQIDGHDPAAKQAWSVLVSGLATEVGQLHEVLDLLRLPVFPWEPGAKPHLVRITPEEITGRRFTPVDLLGGLAQQ